MRRIRHWIAGAVTLLATIVALALVLVDTGWGHRLVAERIGTIRTANGLRFAIGRIDGSVYGATRLRDLRVYDLDGLLFSAPDVALDWAPWRWLKGELAIERLAVPAARLEHVPHTRKTGKRGPILPDFDIRIGDLAIDRLVLAPPVSGRERTGRLAGRADIRSGRAMVTLAATVAGSDRLRVAIDAEPARDTFRVDVAAAGAAGGVLASAARVNGPVTLTVDGDGRWAAWRGRAVARAAGASVLDLALSATAGRYTLAGTAAPSRFLTGKGQRLTAPRVLVEGAATYGNRRLAGQLGLRSAALAVTTTGEIDLAASVYRNVRVRARLLRPTALFPNMSGQGIELRAILDGAFDRVRYDYRLTADRLAFDNTGFDRVRIGGAGRWSLMPVTVPIRLAAARVTGVGDVAGGILRNLSVDGALRLAPPMLTGDALRLRSDKLQGRITLALDLRTGRYRIGLGGALGRYLIPGIGVVDVQSRLQVVPGPGGRGTRIAGRGEAQVRRLDNAFFRSLAGGLPRITTGLERTSDGVLHFTGLVLTAPSLRLAGNGYRRRDGTFHFEGAGRQATYGPVSLVLDGRIERPTLDLRFASPNATLGLRDVRAHLDPTPQGFAFMAEGRSRLGPFRGRGAILLPSGGQASIGIDTVEVAGSRGSGRLAIVDGGFDGRIAMTGALTGDLTFRPEGAVQRIDLHLAARGAQLDGATLRQGRLDGSVRLNPAGPVLDLTAQGQGLRYGGLLLARFAGTAKLVDGIGEVRAAIAGSRGRSFDIQTVTQVRADGFTVNAQGTLDRRPIRLLEPAVIVREGEGWRVQPTRLTFAGGEARLAGRWSEAGTSVEAGVTTMPLTILDIGFPGLGLGGSASGTLTLATPAGGAPTGRMDMTVRGLTRAGLVLNSTPIDVAMAGVLRADRAGLRAVMAAGGKTIGRAQAQLAPLGQGTLTQRLAGAGLFAQLRYAGPADALWRLTGVELFDLSGPVSIGADVTGRLSAPLIRGALQTSAARIESATTGTLLTNVQTSGRFAGSRLAIDRFAADAGRGGRVTGSGQFDLAGRGGVGLDLRMQADHAVLIARDDIGATVSGPLRFASTGTGGTISGDVTLDQARYRLGQATAATAAPQLNVREINVPGGVDTDDRPATPWTLALNARARSAVAVTGLGLTSEWSANLQIGGAPDNPAITGQARLIRGDYEFAGREFELSRGIIRFGGETPANPSLDIEANANTTGLNASIRVTGTAMKPEIGFASVPALPEDELLSRLLFGTSITNLSAPEALQLAAAVAALQDSGGGLNPINAVRRAAGLDRLRILPADPQTGQGTSIAAGKYVTRRLYAEIVTDGQGYSATQVEFQVTRWLSLLSSISTLGRQSVNVRVSRDY
ncbi:translocation/assembly module TamB domain-containing protein [Sphingomonas sp. CFBP 8760]|uniref:translocation/assembly module TamB domain-containing protein n=1 Tax=Sphingomonas sp. CFBP 8760 TaxID=2775282 RepID=UPI0017872950|nr:translocation/assembly module TamB domain-containing protein [Sphingomonas sp. CFBP 8760]MBD8548516.1 translocation/assembly module TamB domain-containing protein [Sphingomonas sp. CFBP 8760]